MSVTVDPEVTEITRVSHQNKTKRVRENTTAFREQHLFIGAHYQVVFKDVSDRSPR